MTAPLEPPATNKKKRNLLLFSFTLLLLVIGLVLFAIYYFYWQYHETTDDAYAGANMVNVNSVIDGSVVAFYADDTDLVEEGQLLVQLDPTYYQMAYERALAALSSEVLQVKQLYDNVFAAEAEVAIQAANLSRTRFDYENRSRLVDSKAISNEDFIHSQDALTIADNQLKKAEYQLKAASQAVGDTPFETHPRIEEKKALIREAYYNLKHTSIYAPTTGYVAQRAVNVGQFAPKNRTLMAIIPTDYVWVNANFKETQLKWMRVGQPAEVWFDLYGSDVKFEGKVLGIASGTGSVFSLIPPQNATGNWIKIVQRLPVRIGLDPEETKKYPIRLGISAEVDVDISNSDLPLLAPYPQTKSVAATKVYDLSMEEVNKVIDEILSR